ncbi:MAG: carbamoyltransferase, partial [Rhizobacter sp.]|nr:carbamoyltransferase [Rhizobacter sp.]
MITLGINAAFHDSAAALVRDGVLVAAAEEERFSRIKHGKRPLPFSTWELPFNAIDYCLKEAGLTLADVDHVAYSYDPSRFLKDREMGDSLKLPLEPSAETAKADGWDNPWDPLFIAYILNAKGQLVDGAPHHLQKRLGGVKHDGSFQFHHVDHHLCHQASAFLASPFDSCAVMTLDGRGEEATTTYGVYRDGRYKGLGEVVMPNSLGMLYEKITTHLGFLHSSDEYKVMALAAMGKPRFKDVLQQHLHVRANGQYDMEPMDLTAMFGPPRGRGTPMQQEHFDIAASLQVVLEETVMKLARWLRDASGQTRVAMAGGVALNCVMNAKLRDSHIFDEVWVQPAAGDSGTALGAALWIDAKERAIADGAPRMNDSSSENVLLAARKWQMDHAYWGPGSSDDEIEAFLKWAKLPYRRTHDVAETTARLLAANNIIGWYQGRMEYGPRALGARSILASPIDPEMQARLNELKDREDFRPVAPAVPEEN